MYILSQDKTKLVAFDVISIEKGFGKSYLSVAVAGKAGELIGEYDSEIMAKREIEHIVEALRNDVAVYEVR